MKVNHDADTNGTHLQGYVKATYGELQEVLGEPEESDGYKVSGQWTFEDENGQVFTLYDWKATDLYGYGPSVEEFRADPKPYEFHVGGHVSGRAVARYLTKLLGRSIAYTDARSRMGVK